MCAYLGHNVNMIFGWWTFSGALHHSPVRSIYESSLPANHYTHFCYYELWHHDMWTLSCNLT